MADPITREQVERAIECAKAGVDGITVALGGFEWPDTAPDYVRELWHRVSIPTHSGEFVAALTRWRDELAAAEGGPEPVAHHAASERVVERLRAMTSAEALAALVEAGIVTPDGELTEAYRARPESIQPAEDSPERLRERREALGMSEDAAGNLPGMGGFNGADVACCEARATCSICDHSGTRGIYAAALSAEEARRAARFLGDEEARAEAFHAEPERPAPRGWTRHSSGSYWCLHCNATGDAPGGQDCANCNGLGWRGEPGAPPEPAPEVVDVPQPETWHTRLVRLAQAAGAACAEAEAAFARADAEREKARLARAAAREVCHVKRQALTEATTAASIIRDAQQGGAS